MGPLKGEAQSSAAGISRRLAMTIAGICFFLTATAAFADHRRGDESRLDVDPPVVDFGKQAVDSSSAPHTVKLSNRGHRVFTVTGFRIVGAFGETSDCDVLTPGASCTFKVTFSPRAIGPTGGAVIIQVSDGDKDDGWKHRHVRLIGRGIDPTGIKLSGTAVQGGMNGATVSAWAVSPSDGSNSGATLATATADGNGNFTLTLTSAQGGPIRLTANGGSFVSEMNGATIGSPGTVSVLLASATAIASGISINPLSTFVDSMAVGKLKSGASSTLAAALSAATAAIEADYGLKSDPATLLPDYSSTGVGTDAGNVGLILGALINEGQSLCLPNPIGLIGALSSDISDGVFDGMAAGSPVSYCGGNLPALAGTSDFQDSLSGLQQLQLVTAGFGFGGSYGPAGNALMSQSPPVTPALLLASFAAINDAITQTAPAAANAFASTGTPLLSTAREFDTATLLPNGKVLIAGGYGISGPLNTAELYDPVTNSFSPIASTMSAARAFPTATLLLNGRVLIAGGFNNLSDVSLVDLYDPTTNTFSTGPAMITARDTSTATLLPNGKVLIAGGFSKNGVEASAELYDPIANSFSAVPGGMTAARYQATATLLPNGKVLVTGGSNNNGILSSTELYDPAANSFTAGPALQETRESATATLLSNGKVLIAGGDGDLGYLAMTDIYDTSTNLIAAGPSMNTAREAITANLLPNGKVLIAGGYGGGYFATTELYDPATNSFAAPASTASMNSTREFATGTLLRNGEILIAGGDNVGGFLNTTEMYTP